MWHVEVGKKVSLHLNQSTPPPTKVAYLSAKRDFPGSWFLPQRKVRVWVTVQLPQLCEMSPKWPLFSSPTQNTKVSFVTGGRKVFGRIVARTLRGMKTQLTASQNPPESPPMSFCSGLISGLPQLTNVGT